LAERTPNSSGLKDQAIAKASMTLALEHAKSLKDARVDAENRSYQIWTYCLLQSIAAIEDKRDLEIPTTHVADHFGFEWSSGHLKRFRAWYGEIIANDLKRLARKNGLVPVGLSLVPAYKGKRHRGLRVVIQSQVWPERETETQPVAAPSETDERTFRARFGFDAPPSVRAQVYQLKAVNELTDLEIRRLKWRGALSTKRNRLVCTPSSWLLGVGIAFVLIACILVIHAAMALYYVPRGHLIATAVVMGLIIAYAGLGWLSYWVFCAPYFFLRSRVRRGRQE